MTLCFLSRYSSGSLPYVRHHITINKMCWVHRWIKHFLRSVHWITMWTPTLKLDGLIIKQITHSWHYWAARMLWAEWLADGWINSSIHCGILNSIQCDLLIWMCSIVQPDWWNESVVERPWNINDFTIGWRPVRLHDIKDGKRLWPTSWEMKERLNLLWYLQLRSKLCKAGFIKHISLYTTEPNLTWAE